MFTGLVEEVGTVTRLVHRGEAGAQLYIRAERVLAGTRLGDSIDVNGACLTVVDLAPRLFAVDCMPETLERTTVGALRSGDPVNLERAMAVGDRLGGHLVLGHVDGVGEVQAVRQRGIAQEVRISLPQELEGYVAGKGSIAVDGISLTVTDVTAEDFGLGLIPHTLAHTTLRTLAVGRRVNLEADVLARYVRQAMFTWGAPDPSLPGPAAPAAGPGADGGQGRNRCCGGGLTEENLRNYGFLE